MAEGAEQASGGCVEDVLDVPQGAMCASSQNQAAKAMDTRDDWFAETNKLLDGAA